MAATKRCPYCAEIIRAEAIVCRFCGRPLTDAPMPEPVQTPTAQTKLPRKQPIANKLGTIFLGLIGFLILCGLIAMLSSPATPATVRGHATVPAIPSTATPSLTERRHQAISPTFEELARNTERYEGRWVLLRGQVIQITESWGDTVVLRVNITKDEYFWSDAVWVNHTEPPRVLEDDFVEILGQVKGRRTYQAVLGNTITVPEIDAAEVKILPTEP